MNSFWISKPKKSSQSKGTNMIFAPKTANEKFANKKPEKNKNKL